MVTSTPFAVGAGTDDGADGIEPNCLFARTRYAALATGAGATGELAGGAKPNGEAGAWAPGCTGAAAETEAAGGETGAGEELKVPEPVLLVTLLTVMMYSPSNWLTGTARRLLVWSSVA